MNTYLGGVACVACGGPLNKAPKVMDCSKNCTHWHEVTNEGRSYTSACGHLYHIHCGHNRTDCAFPGCTIAFAENRRDIIFDGSFAEDFEEALKVSERWLKEEIETTQEALATQSRKMEKAMSKKLRNEGRNEIQNTLLEEAKTHLHLANEKYAEKDRQLAHDIKSKIIHGYINHLKLGEEKTALQFLENQIALDDQPQDIYMQVIALDEFLRYRQKQLGREKIAAPADAVADPRGRMLDKKIAILQDRIERQVQADAQRFIDLS